MFQHTRKGKPLQFGTLSLCTIQLFKIRIKAHSSGKWERQKDSQTESQLGHFILIWYMQILLGEKSILIQIFTFP